MTKRKKQHEKRKVVKKQDRERGWECDWGWQRDWEREKGRIMKYA